MLTSITSLIAGLENFNRLPEVGYLDTRSNRLKKNSIWRIPASGKKHVVTKESQS